MYRLNEAQQGIAGSAAAIAEKHLAPRAAAVDRDAAFPTESLAALGASGLLGLNVPQAYGGLDEGLRTAAAVIDALAQRCPSTAMVYLMHLCGIACYAAVPDKTAVLLREAAAGRHLSTLAFSEKGSRSHFWAPVSRAALSMPGNGTVTISAQKSFVTSAGHADGYVVSTLASGATHPLESTIYVVLKEDAGLSVAGPWRGLGLRVHPGQWRIPGDIDGAIQECVHLRLVSAVEHRVDGRPLRIEEVPDDLPDHRHLRVVHHGADLQRARHQNTSRPQSARPMNS
jgi:alkylation response protein AidB-like acyl-CoA dehydrogenase